MKDNQLAMTGNVETANMEIERLLGRKRSEQRGLALIYGETGMGKTAYVERMAFSRGWLYYRFRETDTTRSFLLGLYQRLNRRIYGDESIPRSWSRSQLENYVIGLLGDYPEMVIVVDEVNLMTTSRRWDVIEVIRDMVDMSFATVILVGEESVEHCLKNYNKHFWDRIGFNVKFGANSVDDFKVWLDAVSEVRINDPRLVKWLHKESGGGNLRKAWKVFEPIEKGVIAKGLTTMRMEDM